MSYDFYIEKIEEFESDLNTIVERITQSNLTDHVKYKVMQSLIAEYQKLKGDLKNRYQSQTSQARHRFPTKCNPVDVEQYPIYSLFLQFKFKLAKPYISRDDEIFYICENPIRKDKVSKIPLISSSTWKGNMRLSARISFNLQPDTPDSVTINRLFGNEKAASSNFHQGRIWFYDTFFNKIGLEVINPHDREKKAGTNPITIEAVPSGEEGYFTLFYSPFDLIGCHDVQRVKEEVSDDLCLLSGALKLMMFEYGFSAKKTAGYGIIQPEVHEVILRMKGLQTQLSSTNGMSLDTLIQELKRMANELRPRVQ